MTRISCHYLADIAMLLHRAAAVRQSHFSPFICECLRIALSSSLAHQEAGTAAAVVSKDAGKCSTMTRVWPGVLPAHNPTILDCVLLCRSV